MKVETTDKGQIVLKEVYSSIKLVTNDGEVLYVSMRDQGFELRYVGGGSRKEIRLNEGNLEHNEAGYNTPPEVSYPMFSVIGGCYFPYSKSLEKLKTPLNDHLIKSIRLERTIHVGPEENFALKDLLNAGLLGFEDGRYTIIKDYKIEK